MKSYDEVCSIEDGSPTPLDPSMVQIFPQSSRTMPSEAPYQRFASLELAKRLDQVATRIDLPSDIHDLVANELSINLAVRCERNDSSMQRLKAALKTRTASNEMLDIIKRAREGSAEIPEMLRLLREYPEMISLELFKATKPFDSEFFSKIVPQMDQNIVDVAEEYWPGQTTPHLGDQAIKTATFIEHNSAFVTKHNICDISAESNHVQVVRKRTGILIPLDVKLSGIAPDYQELEIGEGKKIHVTLQPLTVSYYARVSDYKERLGYISPAGETSRRAAAQPESEIIRVEDEVANLIVDERMRQVYLEQVSKFAGRTALDGYMRSE